MLAAPAYQHIKDIHEAVMGNAIDLDAASQLRLLQMLNKLAQEMVSEQRNSGGDPCATKAYADDVADALDYFPSAIEEMSEDITAWHKQQAQIRRGYQAAGWSREFELSVRA